MSKSNINIEKFNGFKAKIDYEDIDNEYAEKCCERVKENSSQFKPHRKFRHYKDGWNVKSEKEKNIHEAIVYNAKDYRLTHLLENGHLIVNKKNGVGWASAHPHIEPAYKSVKNGFINAIKKAKIDFEFK